MTVGTNETFSQSPCTWNWKSHHEWAPWQLRLSLYWMFFLSVRSSLCSFFFSFFLNLILCACVKKIKKETVGNEPWIHHKVIMAAASCHRLQKQNGSKRFLPPPIIRWIWMHSLPWGHREGKCLCVSMSIFAASVCVGLWEWKLMHGSECTHTPSVVFMYQEFAACHLRFLLSSV